MLTSVAFTLISQLAFLSIQISYLRSTDESKLQKMTFYMTTAIMSLVLTILFLMADIYLLVFHVYLINNNLSTYKYIRLQNNKTNKKSKVIKELNRDSNKSPLSEASIISNS